MNQKKKQIINAAQKLFIKQGFNTTSIQDILNEAQIAKGTFYNYFSSKNECLMAILEQVNEEIYKERMKLMNSGEKEDQSIFAKQVEVRFNVDKKHNLLQLFNSVTVSDDKDLKACMEKQYVRELEWIAERFIAIYGPQTKNFAFDHAVTFMGILQHSMLVSKILESADVAAGAIQFALVRMNKIISVQKESDYVFFENRLVNSNFELKTQIIDQLNELQAMSNSKANHFILFLLEEVQEENPRIYLLESVFMSLQKLAEGTKDERPLEELSSLVWTFIEENESK